MAGEYKSREYISYSNSLSFSPCESPPHIVVTHRINLSENCLSVIHHSKKAALLEETPLLPAKLCIHNNLINTYPRFNYEKSSYKSPQGSLSKCRFASKFGKAFHALKKNGSTNSSNDEVKRDAKEDGYLKGWRRTNSSVDRPRQTNLSGGRLSRTRSSSMHSHLRALTSDSSLNRPCARRPASNPYPHISSKSSPLQGFYKQRRDDLHDLSLKTYLPYRTSLLGC